MPKRIIKSIANLFGVLSNPTRLHIILLLGEGEKDVKYMHEQLGLSSSNVSQHLSVLRSHHLVDLRREGTHVFYRLRNRKVLDVLHQALELFELELSEAEALKNVISKVRI